MRVLYIAGWGRSGTTIVDNILGAYPTVFSAGELYYFWRRGLLQRRLCGCGVPLPECELWSAIIARAYDETPLAARETNKIQHASIRVRDTHKLAHRPLDEASQRYRDEVGRLYHAIADVTGAELIVDSSKTPSGAAILGRLDGIDSYLLHMVRDPRAVAYSWMRDKQMPDRKVPRQMTKHSATESSVHWVAWNLLTEDLARTAFADRSLRLRYEDFVADPAGTMGAVLALAGVPAEGGPFVDDRTVELGGNHTVSGNPSRFARGPVTLRRDDAWRTAQTRRSRMVSTAAALPLMRRYGYRVTSP